MTTVGSSTPTTPSPEATCFPPYSTLYVTTLDGFVYKTDLRGLDPDGFMLYANDDGFLNPDGTILDHDVEGTTTAANSRRWPEVPISPRPSTPCPSHRWPPPLWRRSTFPAAQRLADLSDLSFTGTVSANTSLVNQGGTFSFTSTGAANYQIVISQTGTNSSTLATNRSRRVTVAGANSVHWDGNDNNGTAFPVGSGYPVQVEMQSGTYHFPLLDAGKQHARWSDA